MTAQAHEKLIYEGEVHGMCTEPLSDFVNQGGKLPHFLEYCSALWRGYIGTWEVAGKRLYLVGVDGTLLGGKQASLEDLFPGYPDRVFAHWFSGEVRLPKGELVNYVHMGYGSTFERDLFLYFKKGCLTGVEEKQNYRQDVSKPLS